MNSRLAAFLFVCLLFLPSCQHNPGDSFASKADAPMDLHYGPGTANLHVATTMTVAMNGKKGQEVPVISFDAHYVVKKIGSRLSWNLVLDNRQSPGSSPAPEPFYSVSFTTDTKGRNMADKVVHEVPGKNELGLGEHLFDDIELPEGKVVAGDPSILFPVKAYQSENMQVVFSESSPAYYIYDGMKEIDDRECHVFSYEGQLTIRQNGVESPGVVRNSNVFNKQMLPVSQKSELIMNGSMKNMTTIVTCTVRELTAQDATAPALSAEAKAMRDLRGALEKAPLQLITEPMTFRYAPASARFKAEMTLEAKEKGKLSVKLPLLGGSMKIDTAAQAQRMAWNVDSSDLEFMGQPLDLSEAGGCTFTTDAHGRDIRDFQDNSKTGVLSVEDIQSDFIIPEGAYKSGDVCMPVKMNGNEINLQYVFSKGEGFVFQGVKQVDSMRVGVFTADIDHFTATIEKSSAEYHGSLSMVRYYDLATMLPLWFDATVIIDLGKSTVTSKGGMTRIMD